MLLVTADGEAGLAGRRLVLWHPLLTTRPMAFVGPFAGHKRLTLGKQSATRRLGDDQDVLRVLLLSKRPLLQLQKTRPLPVLKTPVPRLGATGASLRASQKPSTVAPRLSAAITAIDRPSV